MEANSEKSWEKRKHLWRRWTLAFIVNKEFTGEELRLLMYLSVHDQPDSKFGGKRKGLVTLSRERMAKELGVGKRQITRLLESLEKKKQVKRESVSGSNRVIVRLKLRPEFMAPDSDSENSEARTKNSLGSQDEAQLAPDRGLKIADSADQKQPGAGTKNATQARTKNSRHKSTLKNTHIREEEKEREALPLAVSSENVERREEAERLLEAYKEIFFKVKKARYFPVPKDLPALEGLLVQGATSEEIKKRLPRYARSDNPFYQKRGYGLEWFAKDWNSFAEGNFRDEFFGDGDDDDDDTEIGDTDDQEIQKKRRIG